MQYTVLRFNDNNTATVELAIDGFLLNQDIDLGAETSDFENNVVKALKVFDSELKANVKNQTSPIELNVPIAIDPILIVEG